MTRLQGGLDWPGDVFDIQRVRGGGRVSDDRAQGIGVSLSRALIGISCAGAISVLALGTQDDRFLYPQGEEIHQSVARVSFVSGNVSLARGDDPRVWRKAAVNAPLTSGDRLFAGKDGRVELELLGGNLVDLAPRSELSILNVGGGTQLALRSGSVSLSVRRVLEDEAFEVDTPVAAVTLQGAGDYRIEVPAAAAALVAVRRGTATVAAGGGELSVGNGQQVRIEGREPPRYDFGTARAPDEWDHWVEQRARRFREIRSSAFVHSEVVGVADLDEFGRWENTPDYGNAWTPSNVDKDWQPYRAGHWLWQDPWGWTFVGEEPWGWAPYHYGRWAVYPSGWFWVPETPTARYVAYSPALVAFLGGGADGSVAQGFHAGADVGWFPLALQDPFYPWWIPRLDVTLTKVTEFVYRNRKHVSVVAAKGFVSGEPVRAILSREAAILQEGGAAPVLRVPLPLPPTQDSLRAAAGTKPGRIDRPSEAILTRPIVARSQPPAGPPAFVAKLEVIRQNLGAPVPPSVAVKIRQAEGRDASTPPAVVYVVGPEKKMTLAPRHPDVAGPRPQPITPAPTPAAPAAGRGTSPGQIDHPGPRPPFPGANIPPPGAPPPGGPRRPPLSVPSPGSPGPQSSEPTPPVTNTPSLLS